MKSILYVFLLLALSPLSACAAGLSGLLALSPVPEPSELLEQEPELYRLAFYEQGHQQFDAYAFSMPTDVDAFLNAYGARCQKDGYTLEEDVFEQAYLCYRIVQDNRLGGMFVMYDQQQMLFLVLRDMSYRPLPASTPSVRPDVDSFERYTPKGGHWEWQTQTLTCPECYGSKSCKLCHGTGTYRLYGVAVPCDKLCSFCDGTGTYQTRQYVFVPD